VDAETGELHPSLTTGQRDYDVDLARTNIIGELMDLQAGSYLPEDEDPIEVGDRIRSRYEELWRELTAPESIETGQRWRVAERIDRLNELGFSVGELQMVSDLDGAHLTIRPKVLDSGHFHRQMMRLTGMDVGEMQAQRMLNDLETYRAMTGRQGQPIEIVAHEWMRDVFEPIINGVPPELRAKLEPAQIFHEVLEHRWFLAQRAGHDIPLDQVIDSYVHSILPTKRDEAILLDPGPQDTAEMPAAIPEEPEDPEDSTGPALVDDDPATARPGDALPADA